MRKPLSIILILTLTIFLSGCGVDIENYYRVKAELEQIDLDIQVVDTEIIPIGYFHIFSKAIYVEIYENGDDYYRFKEQTQYAICKLYECIEITEDDYLRQEIRWED